MDTFLELVAKDLTEELEGDFTRTTIIFPNKRASLFFNKYLADITEEPIWVPNYMTISDMFSALSAKTLCDPIKLVCTLYESFIKVTGTEETLDKFYSWGELMLSDFEDIDNNMADAKKLFANISDLENMTDFSFLSESQIESIRQFFVNFNPENRTRLKDKFLSIWNALYPTYKDFKESLSAQNLCYDGMLKRDVIEQFQASPENMTDKLTSDTYVIIGFNVLNETERMMFKLLSKHKKSLFYWDYDEAYLNTKDMSGKKNYRGYEAGQFITDNIRTFGNRFKDHPEYFQCFKKKKNITYISSPTENAQTRHVNQWISEHVTSDRPYCENAVVLCNESFLPSVLHSIPPTTTDGQPIMLNVTMGYPLKETPIYSFVISLCELQIHGIADNTYWRFTFVANVLRHPITRKMTDNLSVTILDKLTSGNLMFPSDNDIFNVNFNDDAILKESSEAFINKVFTRQRSQSDITSYLIDILKEVGVSYRDTQGDTLQIESVFNAYTIINRIHGLQSEQSSFNVNNETYFRIVRQILGAKSIPFHGEPAIGVQVMGILETRNLDFRNIILLSCNEDKLPKNTHRSSLIPYNLREAYGMTTTDKQVSLYAYYFYNLLQRAENITIMYNSSTEDMNKGEMSRFMMQLQIESKKILGDDQIIKTKKITADSEAESSEEKEIEKTDVVMDVLIKRFENNVLSPTAINTYLECPMKFYLRYIAGFKEVEQVTEDVDNPMFGNIFHFCMEQIYKTFGNRQIQSANIKELADNTNYISNMVDRGFAVQLFNKKDEGDVRYQNKYNGQQLLNHYVLRKFIRNQLLYDAQSCPIRILGTEKNVEHIIHVNGGIKVKLGGIIDRYDLVADKDGTDHVRVVDYKTGSNMVSKSTMEDMFKGNAHFMLQAFYYSDILMEEKQYVTDITGKDSLPNIVPTLMYVAQPLNDRTQYLILDKKDIDDFSAIKESYHDGLMSIIEEIYNPNTSFKQCEDETKCANCQFIDFCKK